MFHASQQGISSWSASPAKRAFDCVCVVLALPLLIPCVLAVAAAVRLTSPGPVLFLQKRVGRNGRTFTILKFRTMIHAREGAHHPITTLDNQPFTPIGLLLRYWKLDELPQLANVLLGHMSLVGPRPKVPEHVICEIPCRPGITGTATIAFAQEEAILLRLPKDQLDRYFQNVLLPAKHRMDAEYLARATFISDFRLLVNSVLRRWDPATAESFIAIAALQAEQETIPFVARDAPDACLITPLKPISTQAVGWMVLGESPSTAPNPKSA